jgi:prepilin-type N-terminal cleavage/methylation domain-containing protein
MSWFFLPPALLFSMNQVKDASVPPRRSPNRGFSFIEMITVVAIISIVVSAAVPVASSLFQRRRELFLRETLMLMRQAIRDFSTNLRDDDSDGELDEDPRGDQNRDGFPGIRGIDDNGDLLVDVDWRGRKPFIGAGQPGDGQLNPLYDWRLRADDDEDMSRDEEAYPSDIFDLVSRTTLLRGKIPRDPTTQQPAWDEKILAKFSLEAANNDLDWKLLVPGGLIVGVDMPVMASLDDRFFEADDILLNPSMAAKPADNTALTPLVDEDPRNNIDDDGDGRKDEDPADLSDIASLNTTRSTNLTTYSSW